MAIKRTNKHCKIHSFKDVKQTEGKPSVSVSDVDNMLKNVNSALIEIHSRLDNFESSISGLGLELNTIYNQINFIHSLFLDHKLESSTSLEKKLYSYMQQIERCAIRVQSLSQDNNLDNILSKVNSNVIKDEDLL